MDRLEELQHKRGRRELSWDELSELMRLTAKRMGSELILLEIEDFQDGLAPDAYEKKFGSRSRTN